MTVQASSLAAIEMPKTGIARSNFEHTNMRSIELRRAFLSIACPPTYTYARPRVPIHPIRPCVRLVPGHPSTRCLGRAALGRLTYRTVYIHQVLTLCDPWLRRLDRPLAVSCLA